MQKVKEGDTVKVHYTGTLKDGSVFDSSKGKEPLEFTVGKGRLIPDFEKAVVGMGVGDSKSIQVAAENAYGHRRDELVITVPRSDLPEDLPVEMGKRLQMRQSNGQIVILTVADVTESGVTLDANHALAGKDLNFEMQLVEIV